MRKLLGCIFAVIAGCSAIAVPSASAQSIIIGPGGVEVRPDRREEFVPPRREEDRYWRAVRDRMFQYREACRDGNRRACVQLGIIIGENRERRADWQRDHPDFFWWERD